MKRLFFSTLLLFLHFFELSAQDADLEKLKRYVKEILPKISGWCSQEKAIHFIDLVAEVNPKVCVEIGVFGGASLFPVAYTLKYLGHGVIYAIDAWDKIECIKHFDPVKEQEHLQWWIQVDLNRVYNQYLNIIQFYEIEQQCITLKMSSEKAVHKIDSIDILYIDGNQSEYGLTQDVLLYLPKVVPRGYIWLDDTTWFQTHKAVEILFESCEFIKSIENGNCFLFRKKEYGLH